jgi:hypothetical protein
MNNRLAVIAIFSLATCGCKVSVIVNTNEGRGPGFLAPAVMDDKTVVLFTGRDWSAWRDRNGKPSTWQVQNDGSVIAQDGDAITNHEFGDFQLHVEFLCPASEGKKGQARSNSGVYLHGRYEIQVLDSFGEPPANNLCGGIYQIAAPLVNASRPAGMWQSYDVVFRAPRLDGNNAVVEPPRVTVIQNGIVIHNNLALPRATPGGIDQSMPAKGPLLLQYHGDPVQYRNIWIRSLEM